MNSVRSADSSTSFYGESNLYSLKSNSGNSGLSTHILRSDWRMHLHGQKNSISDIYRLQYLASSSQCPIPNVMHEPSNSNYAGSLFQPQVSSDLYQLVAHNRKTMVAESPCPPFFSTFQQQYSPQLSNVSLRTSESFQDCPSPCLEMEFNEDEIRLKLQELERALLTDNDDDLVDFDQEMCFESDWVDPTNNILLPSPSKVSSSELNQSDVDSSREERTPKHLLFDCASAISEDKMEEATSMIAELRKMVSIQGRPPERLAAYMVEGLAARMASSGRGLYKALKCKEPPASDRLSAMQILFEICPCFKFGLMAANAAIAEAFKDEERVHIIDFDINQGSQYISLIQSLAQRTSKLCHLRITGVDDPEAVQRSVGGLDIIGQRLEKLAEEAGISFEFRAIPTKTVDVTPTMLECRLGEALVVNFAYQLHLMPDESVSTLNQRDNLLRMVKSLGPKFVTVVEQDVNANTTPFFPRFVEVYNYYSSVFDSLDATLPRESPDRMNVERQCLARNIINIVACEGEDRIERYEAAGKWRARMTMAGFTSYPLGSYINDAIKGQLKSYCDRYKVKEDKGALYFGWEDKFLVVASAWR